MVQRHVSHRNRGWWLKIVSNAEAMVNTIVCKSMVIVREKGSTNLATIAKGLFPSERPRLPSVSAHRCILPADNRCYHLIRPSTIGNLVRIVFAGHGESQSWGVCCLANAHPAVSIFVFVVSREEEEVRQSLSMH